MSGLRPEVVCVPFDLCGPHHGSRLGPLAIQLQGLVEELGRAGYPCVPVKTVSELDGKLPGTRQECDDTAVKVLTATRDIVGAVIDRDGLPIVLGGDHSISIGSISGALRARAEGLAVLWIDAHMDLNTPSTTPSGNMHGMPLAVLSGLKAGSRSASAGATEAWIEAVYAVWPRLEEIVGPRRLRGDRLAWVGLREVDSGEVENLSQLPGALAVTMQDIDVRRLPDLVSDIHHWLVASGATDLWVSFDVDSLDPVFAPGTGTAVRGGLSYREGHLLAELLAQRVLDPKNPYRLIGVDLVEVNPLRDRENETARMAVEWLCSLLGKTIMKAEA
ncbi:MAG: arginase [Fimbriimonadaceae bacterium]|nr:MAG: arginase [Fimbriimonadaceae bacterium]